MSKSTGAYGRFSAIVPPGSLERKRVMVLGCGSMGNPVVDELTRHGVGTVSPGLVHLVDGDVVEDRNRPGTTYLAADRGKPKVEVLAEYLRAVHGREDLPVRATNRMLTKEDVPWIVREATHLDLLCIFIDDVETSVEIAGACEEVCPQIRASFAERCHTAQVGFSVPGVTRPLSQVMSARGVSRISNPQALGCDTRWVASFVSAVCLRLLLSDFSDEEKKAPWNSVLPPCYSNAPLFLIGLRHRWVFSSLPEDQLRSVFLVGSGSDE